MFTFYPRSICAPNLKNAGTCKGAMKIDQLVCFSLVMGYKETFTSKFTSNRVWVYFM